MSEGDGDGDDSRRSGRLEWDPAGVVLSQCAYCRHAPAEGTLPVCRAFPSTIPDEFLTNSADHRRPHDGDDGIRFEPEPGTPHEILARLYAALDRLA